MKRMVFRPMSCNREGRAIAPVETLHAARRSLAAMWTAGAGLVLLIAGAHPAASVQTQPALALSAVSAAATATATWVRIEGYFPGEDVVQLPLSVHVLVRETTAGTGYVRYDLASGLAFTATERALADGLDAGDVADLLTAGELEPDARVLHLAPGSVELLLPPDVPSGPAEVQLFWLDGGTPVLSNPLAFDVPGDAP